MKKCIMALLLVFSLVSVAYAHPGRTDGAGGHYVTDTGEYHYHHGYPAHSHAGGCPYDYDDQTGKNSGKPTADKDEKFPLWAYILGGALAFCLYGVLPELLDGHPKKEKNLSAATKSTPIAEPIKISDTPEAKKIIAQTLKNSNTIKASTTPNNVVHIVSTKNFDIASPFYKEESFSVSARISFGYSEWKLFSDYFIPC